VDPFRDAVLQIFAVGVDVGDAGKFQRLQRRDRRHQLHAVVGGLRLAAFQLLFTIAESEHGSPAARPRIPRTGAVGIDGDALTLTFRGHASFS
jgi:hypothetical protein